MKPVKLVIVEGVPGSGKTTTARFVRDWLMERDHPPYLCLEGDLDHPADYESVACLTQEEATRLIARHPSERELLEQRAIVRGDDVFYGYRKLQDELGGQIPGELFDELARHEIYDLPADKYRRLAAERWESFAANAFTSQYIYIFECCFLQNPLTVLLAKHNLDAQEASRHILSVAESLKNLQPLIIYLDPPNLRHTLEQAARTRPKEWLDFVIQYITGQAWGAATGLTGFDGMVRFYEERRDVERSIFDRLKWKKLWVSSAGQDWEDTRAQVAGFLEQAVTAG